MSIKLSPINGIEPHKAFEKCELGREKYAKVLTEILLNYSDGFVLAINNKWGTGKTTFVEMWRQYLEDREFKTIYFNAWESDFEDDPLIAFMGEFKGRFKKEGASKYKNVIRNAAILSKHIVPIMAQAAASKYFETDGIKDAVASITEGASEVFEREIESYEKKKNSIAKFKKSLSEFVNEIYKDRPLVFIIDELDRCRPNYAVSVLEQIKHFFSIPHIVFVLSIDKEQLGHAVRGLYGSDNIDADEYLRRFIDIEYSLPEPESGTYLRYLCKTMGIDVVLNSRRDGRSTREEFYATCEMLFSIKPATLRQQEKIMAMALLTLRSFKADSYFIPTIFVFMNYVKIIDEVFYNDVRFKKLTIEELQSKYYTIIAGARYERVERSVIWLEAYLIYMYNNYLGGRNPLQRIVGQVSGESKLLIQSVFKDENSIIEFQDFFFNYIKGFHIYDISLSNILTKIDLLESLKM